jgi:hypothetical protein
MSGTIYSFIVLGKIIRILSFLKIKGFEKSIHGTTTESRSIKSICMVKNDKLVHI